MSRRVPVRVTVNGVTHQLDVEPRLLLVHALREQLGVDDLDATLDTALKVREDVDCVTVCGACSGAGARSRSWT